MNKRKAIVLFVVVVLIAAMAFWIYGNFMGMVKKYEAMGKMFGEGQVVQVQAARCQRRDLTEYHDFTGTTEAVDSIEVRARVEGYLQAIHFTDGSFVNKGDLLFTIEQASYIAARDEAAARLKAAEAELERARLDFERMQEAVKIDAVSQQDLSRSQAAYRTAEAGIMQARATLERAQLQVSYTQIRSPISGKVSRHLVDAGNLVGAGQQQTLLATVVQIEPIYVFFYANEQLLEEAFLKGVLLADSIQTALPFTAGLAVESGYSYEGLIRYVDNRVDPMTGTIYVRGELSNEDRTLLPGMFMRVRVPGEVLKNAVLVQEEAVITDMESKYVLVIGENNMLQRRNVKQGLRAGTMRQITEGLTGDEAYVISGQHKVRAGMPVDPQFGPMPAAQPPAAMPGAQGTDQKSGPEKQ